MNKVEVYFIKTLKERAGLLLILTLLLLIPNFSWRIFFIFLMITLVLLPRDMCNGKFNIMMELPLSRKDVFWSSYVFLLVFSIFPQMIGYSFESVFITPSPWSIGYGLLSTLTFSTAYFGIAVLSASFGFGNFGVPFLVLIADAFLGSIRWYGLNPYRMISPIYQENITVALIFALSLLMISYFIFERKGKIK